MNLINGIQNKGRTSMLAFANGSSKVSHFSFFTPATILVTAVISRVLLNQSAQAEPEKVQPRHGVAMHGEVKYPETFTHFDYVNPHAPKGGRLRLGAVGDN